MRWKFWEPSHPISCPGGQGHLWRHFGILCHIPSRTWNKAPSSVMCSESLIPSRTLAPSALKEPQWFLHWGNWGQVCTLLIIGPTPNVSHPALYPFTHLLSHAALGFLHSNYNLNPPTPSLLLTSILYPTRFSRSSQSTPFFSTVPWLKPGMSTEVLLRLQVTTPHLSRMVPSLYSHSPEYQHLSSAPKLWLNKTSRQKEVKMAEE